MQSGVMEWHHSYQPELDYFPVMLRSEMFYSTYKAAINGFFSMKESHTYYSLGVKFAKQNKIVGSSPRTHSHTSGIKQLFIASSDSVGIGKRVQVGEKVEPCGHVASSAFRSYRP